MLLLYHKPPIYETYFCAVLPYLSAEQKAERSALKAEKAEEQSHKIVEVGDRFRHKITGSVSEVISLTGALPFYSDAPFSVKAAVLL